MNQDSTEAVREEREKLFLSRVWEQKLSKDEWKLERYREWKRRWLSVGRPVGRLSFRPSSWLSALYGIPSEVPDGKAAAVVIWDEAWKKCSTTQWYLWYYGKVWKAVAQLILRRGFLLMLWKWGTESVAFLFIVQQSSWAYHPDHCFNGSPSILSPRRGTQW